MKKLSALILALIMLFTFVLPAWAGPLDAFYTADISIDPGNPRADKPEYSYAWLDNIVVRSDPNAVTSTVYKPTPEDYPYSQTYDQFITEVNNYSLLFDVNEETVGAAYEEMATLIYYAVTAMGFTTDYNTMSEYIQSRGINLTDNYIENSMAVSIVYAALKYDAVYVLYNKQVEIPYGATVDYALIIIMSELLAIDLPSGIDTYSGLGVATLRNYVTSFQELPVSDNPDAAEIFHWAKIITASENNYQVPVTTYPEATRAQKEYVDYLYYASILNTVYDINVDPVYLILAMQSTQENALQRFILKSMLDEKQIGYAAETGCEELFVLACQNGFFDLEEDFYTDIFSYELTVAADCDKIWFTPFALASQIGGDDSYLTAYLNGTQMAINSTASTPLNPAASEETVELKIVYDDGRNAPEQAVYKFRVLKSVAMSQDQPVAENDMVGKVEEFIGTIIPNSNTVANEKVDEIFSSIDTAVSQAGDKIENNLLTTYSTELTTVAVNGIGANDTTSTTSASVQSTDRFDFDYLEDLIDGVYVTDANGNIVTTASFNYDEEDDAEGTIIEKVTEAVKESPEVVAVPSSLLAAFSVMGYFMTKKHRDGTVAGFEDETEEEESEE